MFINQNDYACAFARHVHFEYFFKFDEINLKHVLFLTSSVLQFKEISLLSVRSNWRNLITYQGKQTFQVEQENETVFTPEYLV
jgi:hypothetical protein